MKCSNVELWLGELAAHVGNVCSHMINDGAALLMSQNEAHLLSVIKKRAATSKLQLLRRLTHHGKASAGKEG